MNFLKLREGTTEITVETVLLYLSHVLCCVLSHFSHVQLFVTLWAVAHHGILQAGILEYVAIPFSRGSSRLRDQTHISCSTGRFLTAEPLAKPIYLILYIFF